MLSLVGNRALAGVWVSLVVSSEHKNAGTGCVPCVLAHEPIRRPQAQKNA